MSDLELSLRINTDLNAGRREVDQLTQSIEQTGTAARAAGGSFEQYNQAFRQTQQDLRDFEAANAGALRSMDDIAAQEERMDRLMAQGAISMKDYESALTNLDRAESRLTREHQQQQRALQGVLRTADRTAAELAKLDGAARELDRAWRDGRISTEDYERAVANVARRRAEIEAMGGATQRLGLHTQTARIQMVMLSRNLAAGNLGRASMDMARLGMATRGASGAFGLMLGPLGLVAAGVAGVALVSINAWREQRELSNALLSTGNAAGLTEGSFHSLTQEIHENSQASQSQSREIAMALVRTGQFTERTIGSFGRSIALMRQITGQSAEQLARDFGQMGDDVAGWAARTNEQWRFLTAAQYENIRAMEERGDAEAAMLAVSEALIDRYADAVDDRTGHIERGWLAVRDAVGGATRAVMDFGRTDLDYLLRQARNEMEMWEARIENFGEGRSMGIGPDPVERLEAARQEVARLEALAEDNEERARQQSQEALENDHAIRARRRLDAQIARLDSARMLEAELAKLEADFAAATAPDDDATDRYLAERDALEAAIRERHTDTSGERAAENYVRSMERQADAIGKTSAELRLLQSQEHDLTEEQRMRINGALVLLNLEEERQQQMRDAQQLAGLEVQLLRAQGREAEAAAMELEQQYGELLTRLEARGDESGQRIIENLINLNELNRQLADVEQAVGGTLDGLARREQSINVQREAGLISEYDARRQLLEVHRETAEALEQQRPLLEELAQQPGEVGEAAAAALAQMDAEMEKLRATTSLLEETLRTGIEGGLSSALRGLADGTMNLRDAISALGQSVANALADMAAQGLAQSLTGGLFGGGFGTLFASTGGYVRGPGTGTSDDIPAMLSDREFVTRAAVTDQPGALGFLHDFNRRGMAALDDWAAAHHNTGGLAGVPAPSMGPPSLGKARLDEPAKAFSAEVANNLTLNLIDDPDRMADAMRSRAGEEAITLMISRNPAKFRQLLKV